MLIGLNALKSTSREVNAEILDAWFEPAESKNVPASEVVESVKELFDQVKIHNSLRQVTKSTSSIPAMPRFAEEQKPEPPKAPKTPYQALTDILDADSVSSRWLESCGLLHKFMTTDCFVDMTMTSEGGVTSVMRSKDGYRRTVMCRADGTVSQRVTGPRGDEIVRFNAHGEAVVSDKRD